MKINITNLNPGYYINIEVDDGPLIYIPDYNNYPEEICYDGHEDDPMFTSMKQAKNFVKDFIK